MAGQRMHPGVLFFEKKERATWMSAVRRVLLHLRQTESCCVGQFWGRLMVPVPMSLGSCPSRYLRPWPLCGPMHSFETGAEDPFSSRGCKCHQSLYAGEEADVLGRPDDAPRDWGHDCDSFRGRGQTSFSALLLQPLKTSQSYWIAKSAAHRQQRL
jgi:hypothetical protein